MPQRTSPRRTTKTSRRPPPQWPLASAAAPALAGPAAAGIGDGGSTATADAAALSLVGVVFLGPPLLPGLLVFSFR